MLHAQRRIRFGGWRAVGFLGVAFSAVALVAASTALAADTVRPVVDVATLTPAPDGNANWRRTPPTLNLSATDDVAVDKFQYSLDSGLTYIDVPVTPGPSVTAAVSITQQGSTTVRYRAVDSSGNVSLGVSASTTLNQPSAVGATGVRLTSTTGRAAGDVLLIDTGANQETATIASVPSPAPASPNPNVLLAEPLTIAHAAGAAVTATPPFRTIAVNNLDFFAPLAFWGTQATTLQNTLAVPGATELRLASVTGRAAGDVLVLDQGENSETVTIASLVTPAPAAPAANVLLTGALTKTHLTGSAVYLPAIVDGKVLQSKTLTPLRTDPRRRDPTDTVSNGAGGSAVRGMWVDGEYRYPFPVALNRLAAGKHTQTLLMQDVAGNAIRTTQTFVVSSSFDDLDTVLTQYATNATTTTLSSATIVGATGMRLAQPVGFRAGDTLLVGTGAVQESVTVATVATPVPGGSTPHLTLTAPMAFAHPSGASSPVVRQEPFIPTGTADNLRVLLTQAKDAAALGNVMSAVDYLHQFNSAVWAQVVPAGPKAAERTALTTASKSIANELLGGTADTSGTGITTAPGASAIRYFWNPDVPTPVPGATYKVLVNGKTGSGQFRHESVVDVEAMIQQLGRDNGFDVDIWDPSTGAGTSPGRAAPPGVSLATSPFLDLATLQQYKTVVFDSTVGRNNASGVGATLNPAEFANLQAYIRAGGGFVAIHGATDAYQTDAANPAAIPWYLDLVGGEFTNHGSNSAGGIQPDCGACGVVEIQNVDAGHPATALIPDRLPIVDELYNTNRNPVTLGIVHPLVLENEATLVGQFGYGTGTLMNADHGMVWCRNFDGGRSFVSNLGHSPQLMLDPWYQHMILKGIQTTAGVEYGNCVTFYEVSTLIATYLAAGKINQAGADALNAQLDEVKAARDEGKIQRALSLLDQFVNIAKKNSTGDDKAARNELAFKGRELKDWLKTYK